MSQFLCKPYGFLSMSEALLIRLEMAFFALLYCQLNFEIVNPFGQDH